MKIEWAITDIQFFRLTQYAPYSVHVRDHTHAPQIPSRPRLFVYSETEVTDWPQPDNGHYLNLFGVVL